MQKTKPGLIHVVLLVLLYSSSSFAVTTRYNNIYQKLGGGSLFPVKFGIFQRDTYDTFGAGVSIRDTYDLQGNYFVPVGSTWTWQVHQIADEKGNTVSKIVADTSIIYQGEVGGCPNMWSSGHCVKSSGWAVSWKKPCLDEGLYRLKVLFNGGPVGEDEFYPTRFTPVVTIEAPETARPILKGDNYATKTMPDISGETFLVKVNIQGKVKSNDQCRAPLPNSTVRLTNTIKAGSGGHQHFSGNSELGTGSYSVVTSTAVVDPDIPDTNGTVIEGKTSATGDFFAGYSTGHFGVIETISADVKREASPLYPEIIVPTLTKELKIKAPNLVEMLDLDNGGDFKFNNGTTCNHNPTARWVVPGMRERLALLTAAYEAKFGHRLSFNDASLPYGGVMDNSTAKDKKTNIPKTGGRDNLCHGSHRRGNDIDLNQWDEKGVSLYTKDYTENGVFKIRLRFVTKIAKKFGLGKVEEGPIHYRYINY